MIKFYALLTNDFLLNESQERCINTFFEFQNDKRVFTINGPSDFGKTTVIDQLAINILFNNFVNFFSNNCGETLNLLLENMLNELPNIWFITNDKNKFEDYQIIKNIKNFLNENDDKKRKELVLNFLNTINNEQINELFKQLNSENFYIYFNKLIENTKKIDLQYIIDKNKIDEVVNLLNNKTDSIPAKKFIVEIVEILFYFHKNLKISNSKIKSIRKNIQKERKNFFVRKKIIRFLVKTKKRINSFKINLNSLRFENGNIFVALMLYYFCKYTVNKLNKKIWLSNISQSNVFDINFTFDYIFVDNANSFDKNMLLSLKKISSSKMIFAGDDKNFYNNLLENNISAEENLLKEVNSSDETLKIYLNDNIHLNKKSFDIINNYYDNKLKTNLKSKHSDPIFLNILKYRNCLNLNNANVKNENDVFLNFIWLILFLAKTNEIIVTYKSVNFIFSEQSNRNFKLISKKIKSYLINENDNCDVDYNFSDQLKKILDNEKNNFLNALDLIDRNSIIINSKIPCKDFSFYFVESNENFSKDVFIEMISKTTEKVFIFINENSYDSLVEIIKNQLKTNYEKMNKNIIDIYSTNYNFYFINGFVLNNKRGNIFDKKNIGFLSEVIFYQFFKNFNVFFKDKIKDELMLKDINLAETDFIKWTRFYNYYEKFDFLLKNTDYKNIYFEVKTYSKNSIFSISKNELKIAKNNLENYFICLVKNTINTNCYLQNENTIDYFKNNISFYKCILENEKVVFVNKYEKIDNYK